MADDKDTIEDKRLEDEARLKSEDESGKENATKNKDSDDKTVDEGDDSPEGDKKPDEDNSPKEPPVRKSATASHIIDRKNRTIEKLRSKVNPEDTDDVDDDDAGADVDTKISKAVKSQVAPLIETLASQADETELSELLAREPEAKKYEKTIRLWMTNEHYKGVPPEVIFHHIAFKASAGQAAIQDEKRKIADKEANFNKGGGSTKRKTGTTSKIPSVEEQENMSDKDFAQLQQDVLEGKYKE